MTSARKTILKGGTIVSMDTGTGDLIGDILIDGGTIRSIAPTLEADDAEIVDVSGHIVLPGFIDSHRHLYQALLRGLATDWSLVQYCVAMFGTIGHHFTPEDVHLGEKLGALDALDSGVTSVFDWSHSQLSPEHTDAMVEALQGTGIRATFGYGGSANQYVECLAEPFLSTSPMPEAEVRRLREGVLSSDDALVTLGLAGRGPDMSTMEIVQQEWSLARSLGIRINVHIGQGIFPGRPAVQRLHEAGLLGSDMTFGHCNQLTDEEMKMMADAGVTASVTPEDEAGMGHGWPPIGRLLAAGVGTNVGIDTCMAAGGDQFTAMRCAMSITRGQSNATALDKQENPWSSTLTARQVLEMATVEGARALGQEDKIGSLAEGKQADIITIRTDDISMVPVLDPVSAVVQQASRRAVDNVFVAGRRLKADGVVVGLDSTSLAAEGSRRSADLLNRAGIRPGWVPSFD
ncbi:amidohydrolase family protein [Streptomyces sp. NPDC000880]